MISTRIVRHSLQTGATALRRSIGQPNKYAWFTFNNEERIGFPRFLTSEASPAQDDHTRFPEDMRNNIWLTKIFNTVLWKRAQAAFKSRRLESATADAASEEKDLPIATQYLDIDVDELVHASLEPLVPDAKSSDDDLAVYPFSFVQKVDVGEELQEGDMKKNETVSRVSDRYSGVHRGKPTSHVSSSIEGKSETLSPLHADYVEEIVLEEYGTRPMSARMIEEEEDELRRAQYGTPDPSVPSSKIPCGGCGAHLHCQDSAIPGYMPSELFAELTAPELQNSTCQRCVFLKEHDVALNVSVSPSDYTSILRVVRKRTSLLILMVDLTDCPCSLWPGILEIVGKQHPIFIVGNKVDLLPKDSDGYLKHVQWALSQHIKALGADIEKRVLHVCLISAKTGYGIEDLITKLQNSWALKGDIYVIGCTNVGKSSLFNALLQSDLCKVKAIDIIQRATISPWPGTTLNLLKFPVLRPTPWRLHLRNQRLCFAKKAWVAEEQLRQSKLKSTQDPQYATLIGHVGQTFSTSKNKAEGNSEDLSCVPQRSAANAKKRKAVFEPDDPDFTQGKWCYDTPGTMHDAQILNLLTLDELSVTLARTMIIPRTYRLKPDQTFFLAGLGRIDYTQGTGPILITLFSSEKLPVSIMDTLDAEGFYNRFLGSDVLMVPMGGPERLKDFPPLQLAVEKDLIGCGLSTSCADILLSSAGWVAVSLENESAGHFKAYTPDKRGCFIRTPALLPNAVRLRGKRIRNTPFYTDSKLLD